MSKEVPNGVKIQGCTSKYKLINGFYERCATDHNGKACYVNHSVTPCYIFHTGKARWVISKRVDDGQRCYAFRKDEPPSDDPSKCSGPWVTSTDNNDWSPDTSISCQSVPGSNDVFVQLRLSLEDEMKKYGLVEVNSLKQLWRRLDFNGNNVVSLAEVDKLVVEMTAGGAWPDWLNNKPALMRAFQKAKCGVDGGRDDFIEKCEFHDLLLNIFWFNKLWQIFDAIDVDDDRRIDFREFKAGLDKLGLKLSDEEAKKTFGQIDTNSGGEVLFVEFCAYIRKRVNPDDNPAFDSDIVSGEKAGTTLRKKHGNAITQGHFVQKKTLTQFDEVEAKFKKMIADNDQEAMKKMWQHLDFNGNGKVSLAEIDKFVVENYPILNHKPALMRAYKKTDEDGNKDDFVEKNEFKTLLGNLFYFNKLFWLFDSVDEDHDRRMTFNEFKFCLVSAGVKMAEARSQQEFKKIDVNGGGKILFDEFCSWFAKKECPQAMTAFITPGDSAPNSPVKR
jgi:Ca2+-binding EF-hand superfamily protein